MKRMVIAIVTVMIMLSSCDFFEPKKTITYVVSGNINPDIIKYRDQFNEDVIVTAFVLPFSKSFEGKGFYVPSLSTRVDTMPTSGNLHIAIYVDYELVEEKQLWGDVDNNLLYGLTTNTAGTTQTIEVTHFP